MFTELKIDAINAKNALDAFEAEHGEEMYELYPEEGLPNGPHQERVTRLFGEHQELYNAWCVADDALKKATNPNQPF